MKYRLEVSENQLKLIAESLEVYSRMGAGQITIRHNTILNDIANDNGANKDMVDYHLGEAKKEIFREHKDLQHAGASIGIGQSSDKVKMLYELYKTILHQKEIENKERLGSKYSYNVHTSMPNKMTSEPNMKIEKITDRQLKLERITNEK